MSISELKYALKKPWDIAKICRQKRGTNLEFSNLSANLRLLSASACSAHAHDIERCAREGEMTANVMF